MGHFGTKSELAVKVCDAVREWETRRRLAAELTARYPGAAFTVLPEGDETDEREHVYRRTAEIVAYDIASLSGREHRDSIVVGITGGSAQAKIVNHISSYVDTKINYSKVVFLALNAAGMAGHYQYSANYLVTRLCEIFPSSYHFCKLDNWTPEERGKYERLTSKLSLIIGGAGDRQRSFLQRWLDHFNNSKLPSQATGDFCCVPIDETGRALPLNEQGLKEALESLKAGPSFTHLSDIKAHVILPLFRQPQEGISGQEKSLTEKGAIGHTVLASAIVKHCVLTEATAQSVLEMVLCGHLLKEPVGHDREGAIWRARKYSNTEKAQNNVDEMRDVRIVHQKDRRRRPSPPILDYRPLREILISDPPGQAELNSSQARIFPIWLGYDRYEFEVGPNVRRPGLWAATAVRVAKNILPAKTESISVLDLGCGCGVIGVLLALTVPSVSRVVFSDLDEAALDSCKKNVDKYKPSGVKIEFKSGNLFSAISPNERFDLVVFGPPFYPKYVHTETRRADVGGYFGIELAESFAKSVSNHLTTGGVCLTYLADFLEFDRVEEKLRAAGLQVEKQMRDILYPYDPGLSFPQSYETVSNPA